MYQGTDWSQQLTFYADEDMTIPLVFEHPVMDIRPKPGGVLLATFDDTGTKEGLSHVKPGGVLLLSMSYAQTALIKAATYPIDIFADVDGKRQAITKMGSIQLVVSPRNTQDTGP